jgi:hypothetical protein
MCPTLANVRSTSLLTRAWLRVCSVAAWFACSTPLIGADQGPPGKAVFEEAVRPLLQQFCADCHSRPTSDDRWAFDGYAGYTELVADQKTWGQAQQLLKHHLMPPQGEKSPTLEQRRTILEWIDHAVFYVDPLRPDPGPTTLRRLNRSEYNHSVRDVFGVDFRPADQFPPDDAGYGFDNIADVLSLSPLHLEKYLAAARQVALEATRLSPPYRMGADVPGAKLTVYAGAPELQETVLLLKSMEDEIGALVDVPLPNVYRILVRIAVAGGSEQDRPRVDVLLSGKKLAELRPTTPWTGRPGFFPGVSEFIELPAGRHRLSLRLQRQRESNDGTERIAAVGFFEVSGPFTPLPPQPTTYLRQAFGSRPLGLPILHLSGEDLNAGSGRTGLDTGRAWFASNGFRRGPLILSAAGKYRVRLKVGAQQAGPDVAQFEVRVADQRLGPFRVTAGSQTEQWIETDCDLPSGEHDWQVWFLNEFKDPQSGAERWLWLHEFSIEGPQATDVGPDRDELLQLLTQTGRRLFRRRLTDGEQRKLSELLNASLAVGQPPLASLRVGLEALLVSPKFLFHPRPQPLGEGENGSVLIDETALASRLSYFLWSSVPDEELLSLAERGALRAQLAGQVQRMLRDPKSAALTANFAGQWLQLRDLDRMAPDAAAFPEFDAPLAADMRRESELLFEHILRENRPVTEFLDAEYSFLNARLAAHYGLPSPAGDGFERVSLQGSPRRGVITHASVLTLTSHPTRTSPVKRGKWLLEQMLGSDPPPAPRDVPPLPDPRENESLSLRARLEQHRSNAACAACHAALDPLGFALENYDAIGRWRTSDGDQPIQAAGELVTGERIADWSELRALILRRQRDDFVRCLTEHLLTYALGRGVTYRDKPAARQIVAQLNSSNGGFQDLLLAVCESVPFQRMRWEPEPAGDMNE